MWNWLAECEFNQLFETDWLYFQISYVSSWHLMAQFLCVYFHICISSNLWFTILQFEGNFTTTVFWQHCIYITHNLHQALKYNITAEWIFQDEHVIAMAWCGEYHNKKKSCINGILIYNISLHERINCLLSWSSDIISVA